MRAQPIDDTFLSRFARQYWERKPLVVPAIKSELLELDADEVFKLVVKAADRSRKTKSLLGFKFYVQGIRSSDVETLFVLPRKSDKSFAGYNERMERMYQDYCLVCDELLQVNKDKQAMLIKFTEKLYEHVGFTNRFTEMGLYLGNYRKTPFGVHRDRCGVFSFPVVGKKTFRAWTSAHVEKHPELEQSFRYSKANSQTLTAKAGGMLYWPSSAWHIAESDGSFSATWSLGVWLDKPTSDVVAETLTSLLASRVPELHLSSVAVHSRAITATPDVFLKTIRALKKLSARELDESFRLLWMKRLAQGGLKTQALNDEPFRQGATVQLRDRQIFWTRAKRVTTYAFGMTSFVSSSAKFHALVVALNSGGTCSTKGYSAKDRAAIRALGEAGAFA